MRIKETPYWPSCDFTPRRWQTEAVTKALNHLRENPDTPSIIRAVMGSGKSVAIASIVASIELQPDEVIVITVPTQLLVRQLHRDLLEWLIPLKRKVGRFYARDKSWNVPVVICCMDSLAGLIEKLNGRGRKTALWVSDECLKEGCVVNSPRGQVPIEDCAAGDVVYGFDHATNRVIETKVVRTFKRWSSSSISQIGSLSATGEHPIFTRNGYVKAKDLTELSSVLCIVPNGENNASLRTVWSRLSLKTAKASQAFLQQPLLPGLAEQASIREENSFFEVQYVAAQGSRGCPKKAGRLPEFGSEPVQKPRHSPDSSENGRDGYTGSIKLFCAQWWQRMWAIGSTTFISNETWLDNGVRGEDWNAGKGVSFKLQGGHCRADAENSGGGGRKVALIKKDPGVGPEKGGASFKIGMEGLPLQKQIRPAQFGGCGFADTIGGYVYNLETESGNYFTEGILVHNCHRTECSTILDIHHLLNPKTAIGFTATAFRASKEQSLSLWKKLIYNYTPAQALKDGVVVPYRVLQYEGAGSVLRDQACLEMIKTAKGPGLVNADGIKDAEQFADYLTQNGVKAKAVHCEMGLTELRERLKALARGELSTLVHVSLLAEGVNIPWLRWLCMRRCVASRVRFCQEVGRVLRSSQNKKEAVIYDPHDLFGLFKLDYAAVLGGTGEEEEDVLPAPLAFPPSPLAPDDMSIRARALIDGYLRQLSLAFDAAELVQRFVGGQWRDLAATGKQLGFIQSLTPAIERPQIPDVHRPSLRLAFDARSALTRGTASDLISILLGLKRHDEWPDLMVPEPIPSSRIAELKIGA